MDKAFLYYRMKKWYTKLDTNYDFQYVENIHIYKNKQKHNQTHSIPTNMDKIKQNNWPHQVLARWRGNWNSYMPWVEQRIYEMVRPLWKTVGQFLTEINIYWPHDLEIPLMSIYQMKWKHTPPKSLYTNASSSLNQNLQKNESNSNVHRLARRSTNSGTATQWTIAQK